MKKYTRERVKIRQTSLLNKIPFCQKGNPPAKLQEQANIALDRKI